MSEITLQTIKSFPSKSNFLSKPNCSTVEEIDNKMLKFQNTALSTKLEFLRKDHKSLKTNVESMEIRLKNAETFTSNFSLMWNNLLTEIEFVHVLLKNTAEDKLSLKFAQSFQFVNEIVKYSEGVMDSKSDISKQIKNKLEGFMKNIQNIYSEVFIELQKTTQKINKATSEILQMDINDVARKFFEENLKLKDKNAELEANFNQNKNKIKELNFEFAKMNEDKLNKLKTAEVFQENDSLKYMNECLFRRIRLLSDYNPMAIENSLRHDDKFECVCGGSISTHFHQKNEGYEPVFREEEKQIFLANKDQNGMEIEFKKEETPETNKLKINVEVLQKQNEDLVREKVELQKEIEKFRLEKFNPEELVFNSELFKNLVLQCQDLLKYVNNLKSKLVISNKKIIEIEKMRGEELEEVFAKFNEEKEKLRKEFEKNGSSMNLEKTKEDLINLFDIGQFTEPFIKALEETNKVNESLKNENQHLRNSVNEYKAKYQDEFDKTLSNADKIEQLSVELTNIKLQISNYISYDKFDLKHLSFKEFNIQLNEIITKNYPSMKKRFDEINSYIKTRETKIEHLENKLRMSNNEIKHKQKQIEDLLKEIDITAKIYNDLVVTNKKLTEQIKESDEIKAKIITEKAIEKKMNEQEKTTLIIKLNAEKESIKNMNLFLTELQNNKKALESIKLSLQNEITSLKSYINELKASPQEHLVKIASLTKEIEFFKKDKEEQEKMLNTYIKELHCEKNLNVIKEQGTQVIDRLLILEHKKYKSMMICTVCQKRDKEVVLKNCYHTFCKECIDKNLQLRQRNCPNCRTKFGAEDVRDIFWN